MNAGFLWILALTITSASVWAIALISQSFSYEVSVGAAPVIEYTVLQCFAGLAWLTLVLLTIRSSTDHKRFRLALTVVVGLVLRLVMFDTHPILETDQYRYLWDGAVTSSGHNPYAHSPSSVLNPADTTPPALVELGQSSTPVLERVNQPLLTTPYPIVAQGAFAVAAKINAFDLNAWRWLLFACELLTLGLLLVALKAFALPPLYCAIYWLNPLVIKEVANTTHVDGLLSPLLLLFAIAMARKWQWTTLASLGLAAGVKLWPVILIPLSRISKIKIFQICIFSLLVLLMLLIPMTLSTQHSESGLIAYANEWRMNSPGFSLVYFVSELIAGSENAPTVARLLVAIIVVCVVITLASRSGSLTTHRIDHAIYAIATLLLLAPAVYPWYSLWFAALLVIRPKIWLLILSVTLPLYYSRFYFAAINEPSWFNNVIVWIEFGPVFFLIALNLIKKRTFLRSR